ncbi:type II toxin-antitoxin system death-on-curing family toxin [Mesorhizobium sp. M2D.F.Ca.ET.225.01.1.1]|uniref:type II toxin-antitoxin system death-on-curing family toxin n=1 Tax=unclassified Mesorhizobium TaxID=325217 RepID=UPI000FD2C691|nr:MULTISPECIES: type II toxin-antitoxin system death-on-curing family toxin [unclassified Mesorhizobium]TGP65466.1 type II toxin-antitoxin system death-on-curing family toxin [Mesorhizobium sp. M2D.F.Ca.ET.226.01.1.1]TGP71945.1 type II toxin-antitoxin system death-on-curing family toxin [Mesorhizobium sp. M2D.F.Ca.ET.225.01.1.1]
MPNEPRWLGYQAVLDINRAHVEEAGENHALLFPEKLESAIIRPQNLFYYEGVYDIVTLSVSLMFGIAEAHAFEQGNKRTGFTSGLAFLYENGFDYTAVDDTKIAIDFKKVITGGATAGDFEEMFAEFVVPLED